LTHDGRPQRKGRVKIDLIVTPGGSGFDGKSPVADAVWISNLDWQRYGHGPRTDNEGRLTLPALIPGAKYRFFLGSDGKDYTAEPGRTVDWGDIGGAAVFGEAD